MRGMLLPPRLPPPPPPSDTIEPPLTILKQTDTAICLFNLHSPNHPQHPARASAAERHACCCDWRPNGMEWNEWMNNIELDFNFCIIWHSPRNHHHHAQCVRVYGNTFTVYPHTFIGLCVCTRHIRQECLLLFGVYKRRRAYFRDWNSLHCEIVKRRVEEFAEPQNMSKGMCSHWPIQRIQRNTGRYCADSAGVCVVI